MTTPAPVTGRAKCGGTKRQGDGGPCTRPAGWGTDHAGFGRCKLHGGSTRNHRVAAVVQVVEADAAKLLAHEGLRQVTDPVGALAKLATEAWAMKDALAARVNALDSIRYEGSGAGGEQLRAEVALYERALDRSGKFLEVLAKLGYEERRVRVEEEQAAMVARVLAEALDELGLGERRDDVLRVVARRLEAVA